MKSVRAKINAENFVALLMLCCCLNIATLMLGMSYFLIKGDSEEMQVLLSISNQVSYATVAGLCLVLVCAWLRDAILTRFG